MTFSNVTSSLKAPHSIQNQGETLPKPPKCMQMPHKSHLSSLEQRRSTLSSHQSVQYWKINNPNTRVKDLYINIGTTNSQKKKQTHPNTRPQRSSTASLKCPLPRNCTLSKCSVEVSSFCSMRPSKATSAL